MPPCPSRYPAVLQVSGNLSAFAQGIERWGGTEWLLAGRKGHLLVDLRLLVLARLPCRHLAGEDARGDRVDSDLRVCQGRREHAA